MGGSQCFLATLLVYLSINSIHALESENMLGGEVAPPCVYKYQASIMLNGKQICGGAIIDKSHVVTAAHCLFEEDGSISGPKLTVMAGINNLHQLQVHSAVKSNISKIYTPSAYEVYQPGADIAVLRLTTPLHLGENACLDKIQLPKGDDMYVDKIATVSGYGLVSHNNQRVQDALEKSDLVSDPQLHFLRTRVIANNECRLKYLLYKKNYMEEVPLIRINDSFICVEAVKSPNDPPRGTCAGDSGGPVIVDGNVLVGIVGFGPLNCDEYFLPGAHARVSKYLTFIEKALLDHDDCSTRMTTTEGIVVCMA
ncbi:chymotrypsin-1-like [Copidosoma floridanum]|uniref:chymotrypsin-1-like n=1 Tax=Copidosoma floridanum TaxID=29053 RepID=UPI0006C9D775|nr:chymotrypsin-1-like [Copidosoma floridanum]